MSKIRYLVTVYTMPDGISDGAPACFEHKQKALDAAKAMSQPGSLSADAGDVIVVDEVVEIARFIKPRTQSDVAEALERVATRLRRTRDLQPGNRHRRGF